MKDIIFDSDKARKVYELLGNYASSSFVVRPGEKAHLDLVCKPESLLFTRLTLMKEVGERYKIVKGQAYPAPPPSGDMDKKNRRGLGRMDDGLCYDYLCIDEPGTYHLSMKKESYDSVESAEDDIIVQVIVG